MGDLFDLFGMGGGRRRGPGEKRRGDDVVFPLKVTLDDLYNGMTKKLRLTKSVLCKDCDGKGAKTAGDVTCTACRGQGVRMIVRQIGPGMIQQMQAQCDRCGGEGSIIPEKDRCKVCKGSKVVKEKKTLEVFVTKGMSNRTKIPFKGEGDEAPNTTPGDVIVVLEMMDHPTFKRDGANLFLKKMLTLQEALTGFTFTITHLDNRSLLVKSDPNTIYVPGSVKAIREEGMPYVKNPYVFGNLYIEFDVEFPKSDQLSKEARAQLKTLLPSPPPLDMQEMKDVEEVDLVEVDMEAEKRKYAEHASSGEAYDEDDERRGPQQQASCRTQ
jgi:DnaJ family protein A protein 2